jgi:hypothetical protein
MSVLSTSRSATNTPGEHITDHNALHEAFNGQIIVSPGESLYYFAGATDGTNFKQLPAAGTPIVSTPAIMLLPDDWASVHVDVIWITGAVGQQYRFSVGYQELTVNAAATGVTATPGAFTYTSPLTNRHTYRLITGQAVTVGKYYRFHLSRDSAHADDTSATSPTIYGFAVRKAS